MIEIGQRPAGRAERAEHFGLIADQAEIDRIAGDPEAGPGDQIVALDELLAFGALPDRGEGEIGDHRPERENPADEKADAAETSRGETGA